MKVAFFSTKPYDRRFFAKANETHGHEIRFLDAHLTADTASLASGYPAVCAFVNDRLDANALRALASGGMALLALRSAGYNHVDLTAARELGLRVVRVPAYSPGAVAEHTVALILTLNRKIHRAHARVREGNFLLDGLLGFTLQGRTVGIVGTGRIGVATARILNGFGCRLLGYDVRPHPEAVSLGVKYVGLPELYAAADIVTLHCPLTAETRHLINADSLRQMKRGVMLINTGRGALIDTPAVVAALKDGQVGYLGLDVYEEEADLFFEDLSNTVIQDDVFTRLLTFPNVIITGHQGFFTEEALADIAETTLSNITAFANGRESGNEVR